MRNTRGKSSAMKNTGQPCREAAGERQSVTDNLAEKVAGSLSCRGSEAAMPAIQITGYEPPPSYSPSRVSAREKKSSSPKLPDLSASPSGPC